MRFSQLYILGLEKWPKVVQIGNGYPVGDGYLFPDLTAIHDKIEERLDRNDDWSLVMEWSLFQSFHATSKLLHANNEFTLVSADVCKKEIQNRLSRNLEGEDWGPLLAIYENDL